MTTSRNRDYVRKKIFEVFSAGGRKFLAGQCILNATLAGGAGCRGPRRNENAGWPFRRPGLPPSSGQALLSPRRDRPTASCRGAILWEHPKTLGFIAILILVLLFAIYLAFQSFIQHP